MTELKDRLDRLARQATEGVDLLSPELMVRARHRYRVRVGLGVAGGATLVVVGCIVGVLATSSQHATVVNVETSPTTPPAAAQHVAPLPDTAVTPPGWSPVAVGTVQVSVPSTWSVEDPSYCGGGSIQGMVFVAPHPDFGTSPQCSLAPNVISILPASSAPVPNGTSGELNSIPVTSGGRSLAPPRRRSCGHSATTSPLAGRWASKSSAR